MKYEVAWQEFNRNDRVVTKRKAFKTEEDRSRFMDRICEKDNFYQILGVRN